jgi:hypothetical protein
MAGKYIITGLAVILICSTALAAGGHYRFVLKADDTPVMAIPLSIDLTGINTNTDTKQIMLYRVDNDSKTAIPCQIESGHNDRLWFIPDRIINPHESVTLEIAFEDIEKQNISTTTTTDSQTITLRYKDKNILRYQHAVHDVPKGVDPLFRRSGFIHPLWSPQGQVLTRILPPDHYHHYGIWNPWTKANIEGRKVDFWNLGGGKATVRFAGIVSTVSGPIYAGFKVRHEHIELKPVEKIDINELLDVRAFASQLEDRPIWIVDHTSIMHNALDTTIELLKHRYGGGIGFRATELWTKDTSSILTSEGKTRKNADSTRARWCDVNGTSGRKGEFAGIVFFSHKANRQHPEPMRIWPENMLNRGDVYFQFCPVIHQNWYLEPEKEYVLRYRMIVYNGKMNPETAELLWKNYVQPPLITREVQKSN